VSLEANRLKAAFRLANRRIASRIADSQDLRGMATTASAILLGQKHACVAHVGDSRVYVLKDGELHQITHDHSWVEEQVRAGTRRPSAAGSTSRRSRPPPAIGTCCARTDCSPCSPTSLLRTFSDDASCRSMPSA